jgi:hypothetical protein
MNSKRGEKNLEIKEESTKKKKKNTQLSHPHQPLSPPFLNNITTPFHHLPSSCSQQPPHRRLSSSPPTMPLFSSRANTPNSPHFHHFSIHEKLWIQSPNPKSQTTLKPSLNSPWNTLKSPAITAPHACSNHHIF